MDSIDILPLSLKEVFVFEMETLEYAFNLSENDESSKKELGNE